MHVVLVPGKYRLLSATSITSIYLRVYLHVHDLEKMIQVACMLNSTRLVEKIYTHCKGVTNLHSYCKEKVDFKLVRA